MRDLDDHYGPLVTSTDKTGRSQDQQLHWYLLIDLITARWSAAHKKNKKIPDLPTGRFLPTRLTGNDSLLKHGLSYNINDCYFQVRMFFALGPVTTASHAIGPVQVLAYLTPDIQVRNAR